MGGPMKQLFLVLFFTLIHGNMLSEEITLKCNYFTHSGNEKPFRDHSDDPYINSRCDEQKLDRNYSFSSRKQLHLMMGFVN